eukprot:3765438-Heterocapsa_arctica.AAC.1
MTPEAMSLAGIFVTNGNLESRALQINVEENDDDQPSGAAVKKARTVDARHRAAGLFAKDKPAADMDAERDRALA